MIHQIVARHFDVPLDIWRPGCRVDDISRAMAAYVARRLYRHRSKDVAAALGYASASGVAQAILRVERSRCRLTKDIARITKVLANTC